MRVRFYLCMVWPIMLSVFTFDRSVTLCLKHRYVIYMQSQWEAIHAICMDGISLHICLKVWERAQVTKSITPSYTRQHDVLEHISQHATLALPQPDCATHLSKCHRGQGQCCLKTLYVVCSLWKIAGENPAEENPIRTVTEEGDNGRQKISETRKNTFPGQDIAMSGCCHGYSSQTTTSLKVNTAWWMKGATTLLHYVFCFGLMYSSVEYFLCAGAHS